MKVLVVDNDISRVKTICKALRDRFQWPSVWMAQDAQEAIKILWQLKDTHWDFVFLDHHPEASDQAAGRNGEKVAMAMREIGVKAKRVVIQSANPDEAEKLQGILNPLYRVVRATFPDSLDAIAALR